MVGCPVCVFGTALVADSKCATLLLLPDFAYDDDMGEEFDDLDPTLRNIIDQVSGCVTVCARALVSIIDVSPHVYFYSLPHTRTHNHRNHSTGSLLVARVVLARRPPRVR